MAGVAGAGCTADVQVFLTAGLFVGVVVMRLFAPRGGGGRPPARTRRRDDGGDRRRPVAYAADLAGVRPELAAFGGVSRDGVHRVLFNCERKDRPLWIAPLERPFFRLARRRLAQFAPWPPVLAARSPGPDGGDRVTVVLAGAVGIAGYALVKAGARFGGPTPWPSLSSARWRCSLLLEILDDTYSFSDTGSGAPVRERLVIAARRGLRSGRRSSSGSPVAGIPGIR